jgi:hypothetical protein
MLQDYFTGMSCQAGSVVERKHLGLRSFIMAAFLSFWADEGEVS